MYLDWAASCLYLCFLSSCVTFVAFVACSSYIHSDFITGMWLYLANGIRTDCLVFALVDDTFRTATAFVLVETHADEE